MGKDSEYYKAKTHGQKVKLSELLMLLPNPAVAFIQDKRVTSQPSTLIAYCYDLLMFFRFLKDKNPYFRNIEIIDITIDQLSHLMP